MSALSRGRLLQTNASVEAPWYFREEITSSYETWYEGKYKKADLKEKAVLERAIRWIGEVKTIAEVGCGTGHFSRFFDGIAFGTYGFDLSPYMLKEAKRLWTGDKIVRASSSHLPLEDKCVDAVGFVTCFEYMSNPIGVIREAARVARRGIFFGLMNAWSTPTLRRKVQIAFGKNPYYKTAHFYSLREIKKLLGIALQETEGRCFQRSTVFPRVIPLEESRLPLGAFLCVAVRLNLPGPGASEKR
jgi:ubiquinone/menaquinone biosynthesis C-methylase UbiE